MAFLDPKLDFRKNKLKWFLLRSLSLIYETLIRCWLGMYRSGIKSSVSVSAPVISVGNITVGGTGKTPLIDWLLDYFENHDQTAAILTRGYKSKSTNQLQILDQKTAGRGRWDQFGDEPWLLHQNHPRSRIFISPDRIKSALEAQSNADVLLLDDGMQHLKLGRDLDIVLIDASSGIGNGHLLPLGPLREPLKSLKRADVILYTKTNLAPAAPIRHRLKKVISTQTPQFDCEFVPQYLISSQANGTISLDKIEHKKWILFSGIGNPQAFEMLIKKLGGEVTHHHVLSDHNEFNDDEVAHLERVMQCHAHDHVMCTEKDWVKLEGRKAKLPEVFRLKMKMQPNPLFIEYLNKFSARA